MLVKKGWTREQITFIKLRESCKKAYNDFYKIKPIPPGNLRPVGKIFWFDPII